VLKIHQGGIFKDTVSFNELQELAKQSMEVAGDNEREEEIDWFEKLQKTQPKSEHLGQKSIASSVSDFSYPTAPAGTRVDAHNCLGKQSAQAEKGKTSFFHSVKRKNSPRFDPAAKRVKRGEME
jgi:hypothetical protein